MPQSYIPGGCTSTDTATGTLVIVQYRTKEREGRKRNLTICDHYGEYRIV